MDEKGWTALTRKLVNLGAKDDDIMKLKVGLGQIRQRWDDLFSAIGRTLEPEELRAFKNEFGNKFKNYLGATYDVMQNKSMIPWLRYRPTDEAIQEVKKIFSDTYKQVQNKGKTLDPLEAEQAVQRVLDTAELPKGMRMDKPSDPYFAIPEFFLGKTVMDDVVKLLEWLVRPLTLDKLLKNFSPLLKDS